MASMGTRIVPPTGPGPYCFRIHDQIYHSIGPLHPEEGKPRQYGQVYILDTSQAAQEELGIVQNISCDATLMRTLSRLTASINPYAQSTSGEELFNRSPALTKDAILLPTHSSSQQEWTDGIDHEWNPLLYGGKLLQQFNVDAYVKIERNRLHYQRTHQKELRLDKFIGLADYVGQEDTDITGPPGRIIVLGSSFEGDPRNMQQSYQDAMAIDDYLWQKGEERGCAET
ncbi:unnamed protein product [Nippostrongylus brasiliensis]|uniref:Helitron_like_N domain-containing protein n=1 Tax=Nippostrongylus brasiliensis TaxID=27835 RepID=A0A0N4YPF1_NIPBR|nr:unnamed protein product [Nippostrongylus brasiliensis]